MGASLHSGRTQLLGTSSWKPLVHEPLKNWAEISTLCSQDIWLYVHKISAFSSKCKSKYFVLKLRCAKYAALGSATFFLSLSFGKKIIKDPLKGVKGGGVYLFFTEILNETS